MSVLMIGVDESTKGGMWTVVENYLNDEHFILNNGIIYVPTCITGCSVYKRILFTLKSFLRIHKLYKQQNFKILHVHMSERASIYRKGLVMRYAKKRGSKIVLHMHGAEFEMLYRKMNKTQKASVKRVLNMADKILILGHYWQDFISSLVDDPQRIQVVYNAVNVPPKYKYNIDSRNILFLGAVSQRKGIHVLLEALCKSREALQDMCCVNIYGPDVNGNISDLINEKQLSGWVKYCGWLNKDHKKAVLSNTSINVLPSFHEGLPMTILEAMSYGIPSIATSIAAIPEAVNHENGIIVSPGDAESLANALKELVHNDEKRGRLSQNAYKDAVRKFTIEKHILKIETVYKELGA